MHIAKRTAPARALTTFVAETGERSTVGRFGFDPGLLDPDDLPVPHADVSDAVRERAALMVLAVAYGHCPEDIARGIAPRVRSAFDDEFERDEALAHVDLLLEVLQPRTTVLATS